MPSKQLLAHRANDLKRLNSLMSSDCPLSVSHDGKQYVVTVHNKCIAVPPFKGRYEVVAAFIAGYVACDNDQI